MKDYFGTPAIDYDDYSILTKKYSNKYFVITSNEQGGMMWVLGLFDTEDDAYNLIDKYKDLDNDYWPDVRMGDDVYASKISGRIGGAWYGG